MYLKSDQDKHQKMPTYGAAPYLYISILVPNLMGWLLSQSVLESDWISLNVRCSENSVAQRGEVVY